MPISSASVRCPIGSDDLMNVAKVSRDNPPNSPKATGKYLGKWLFSENNQGFRACGCTSNRPMHNRNGTFRMGTFLDRKTAFFQVRFAMVLRLFKQQEASLPWS